MYTLEYGKNPIWNDAESKEILLTVKFLEVDEELPFTATSYDWETEQGKDIYNAALNGDFGEIAPFVPVIVEEKE